MVYIVITQESFQGDKCDPVLFHNKIDAVKHLVECLCELIITGFPGLRDRVKLRCIKKGYLLIDQDGVDDENDPIRCSINTNVITPSSKEKAIELYTIVFGEEPEYSIDDMPVY